MDPGVMAWSCLKDTSGCQVVSRMWFPGCGIIQHFVKSSGDGSLLGEGWGVEIRGVPLRLTF